MATRKPNKHIRLEGLERKLYLLRAFWRPILSFVYVLIILCDFVVFPMGWSVLQTYLILSGAAVDFVQWIPMTLQQAGLFHVVLGSFLGITSFTRSLEKREGVADDDIKGMMGEENYSNPQLLNETSEETK